jgi:hypothetical protein
MLLCIKTSGELQMVFASQPLMQSKLHGVEFQPPHTFLGKYNYEEHHVAKSHSHLSTFSVKIMHQSKSDQGLFLSQRSRNHEAGPVDKK